MKKKTLEKKVLKPDWKKLSGKKQKKVKKFIRKTFDAYGKRILELEEKITELETRLQVEKSETSAILHQPAARYTGWASVCKMMYAWAENDRRGFIQYADETACRLDNIGQTDTAQAIRDALDKERQTGVTQENS